MEKKVTGVKPIVKPAPVEKKGCAAGEKHPMYELCLKHMHRYVKVTTYDGCCYHGIVEHVDDEYLYLAVPAGQWMHYGGAAASMDHAFVPYGFYGGYPGSYPGYYYGGFYPGYYPFGYYRPFNRLILPLAALTALALLPYY
ncbi:hypothetical protein [Paenibacillus dendritiformis]|uniref:hypothetical protein n=1 Tax=Paenibacillus dendritiformis TaxID=130049 RepID=UPI003B97836D